MSAADKNQLRRTYRKARSVLSMPARHLAERQALRHMLHSGLVLKGKRWGAYLPFGAEFNVLPLINQLLWMRREVCVPILPSRPARPLRFVSLTKDQSLTLNRHDIVEPLVRKRIGARQLDVLLVPLVAFDSRGVRLGMGGGYYDATLSYLRNRRHWRKPRLVGVAYACQRAENLPAEGWDVLLDAVLTENGIEYFNHQ